jgi:hypothetical protein
VVVIPPRPFLRPAFEAFRKKAEQRMGKRLRILFPEFTSRGV